MVLSWMSLNGDGVTVQEQDLRPDSDQHDVQVLLPCADLLRATAQPADIPILASV